MPFAEQELNAFALIALLFQDFVKWLDEIVMENGTKKIMKPFVWSGSPEKTTSVWQSSTGIATRTRA